MTNNTKSLLLAALFASSAVSAQIIAFDSASDFNNNFVEVANGDNTVWNDSGYLVKTVNNQATGLVYNPNDNGAVAANRAAGTYDNPRSLFGGTNAITFSADFQFSANNNGNSLGFYFKVPDATEQTTPSGGYAILFRTNTGGGEVRFWDYSTGNSVGTAAVNGAPTNTQTFDGGTLNTGTWYTAQIQMQDVGTEVVFNASLFYTGGSQIGTTKSWTDSTSAVLGAGQVGLRLSTASGSMLVDNVVIPEPSTYAMLGGLAALGLAMVRRRMSR